MLEGLTGFGFPRDAELCTRYATQITCRRESEQSIDVSIIPHADAAAYEQERVKKFHRTLKAMTPESLAEVFKEVGPIKLDTVLRRSVNIYPRQTRRWA